MEAMETDITIRDKYGPAMKLTDPAEAVAYFEVCVEHTMRWGKSRAEAELMERSNFGYFAGYCDNETRRRVEELFSCAHPIFGAIKDNGTPSTADALAAGARLAATASPPEGEGS